MQKRFARPLLVAACLLSPVAVAAADLIPVEDFARHPSLSDPSLSPDGKYLAMRMDDNDGHSHAVVIYNVDDMQKPVSLLRMPMYEIPLDITWVSATRLILSKGKEQGSLAKPITFGEILATDVNGKHQDYLYGYQGGGTRAQNRAGDDGWGSIVGTPAPTDGHFYMGITNSSHQERYTLYNVDAVRNTRSLITDFSIDGMDFMIGADGTAHYAYGSNDDFRYMVYHHEGSNWVQLGKAQVGDSFVPITYATDKQRVYAKYSADGGPMQLVEQDENGGNRTVLAKERFDSVGRIEWTALPEQPFATIPATGLPKPSYIDTNLAAAKLHIALSRAFPNGYVHFIQFNEDGKQLLFSVSSDRDPGTYYLIDTTTFKARKLFALRPWIDPTKMAERRPLHFKASDGTELEAILTLPPGRPETNLPMVLVPHGGPFDVQDDWFFDDDAQFLANRGYLVLQVNFRGSSGRGPDFVRSGYRKWGTAIQQDLIDGAKWAIGQHYADASRICVYGASFGGYSALMAPIRAPGLFKCAVGYAGVYDLAMMYDKGDTQALTWGRSFLKNTVGTDPNDLVANSPDKLADKIDVPVLLIHGEDDQRAPFAQAKAMRAALEAAHKPYEWLSKPGEGHGFYGEKDNVDFYNALQAFLEKHIGKGA